MGEEMFVDSFILERYSLRRNSIFLPGLVETMFISYVLDDVENCDDRSYKFMFFLLGLSHFLSMVVMSMETIISSMEERYSCKSSQHHTKNILNILMHVIKGIQFPLVLTLGYFIYIFSFKRQYGLIKFNRNDNCSARIFRNATLFTTNDTESPLVRILFAGADFQNMQDAVLNRDKTGIFSDLTGVAGQVCDFCQATDVTLGAVVFLGQVFVGMSILILWYYVWYFKHSGLQPYNRRVKKEEGYVWNVLENYYIKHGLKPFFDDAFSEPLLAKSTADNFTGALLSISLSFPVESCNNEVMEWLMSAGVLLLISSFIEDLKQRLIEMVGDDVVYNRNFNTIYLFLTYLCCPIFIVELFVYGYICYVFFHYRPTVDWEDMKIEHYCVKGIWHLVLSLIIVFALLLVYRIVVVLNSYYKQFRKHASLKQIKQESEIQKQNQESGNQEEGRVELKIPEKPEIPILAETDEEVKNEKHPVPTVRWFDETSKAANDKEVHKLQEEVKHQPNELQGDKLPEAEEQRDDLQVKEDQEVELLLDEVYSPFPTAPSQHELPVEGLISRTIWDWKTE